MKKYVLKFGLIVGVINALSLVSLVFTISQSFFDYSEVLGYSFMLVAFGFVYLGIKKYRDEYLQGTLSFGKALLIGLLITLVAATIYVLTWLIVYYNFIPDFMDKYADACFEKMKKKGSSDFDIADKMKEIAAIKEMYQNPLLVILITFSEILPVGILASLISSLVLRKKAKTN